MDFEEIGVYNFSVIQGINDVHSLFNWEVNGKTWDLSSAADIRIDFRTEADKKGEPSLSLTRANGGITVVSNSLDMNFGTNTLEMNPGIYLYDVLVIKEGKRYVFVRGQMTLNPTITK